MHGGIGRRSAVRGAALTLALTLCVACGGSAPEPIAVPTFPATPPESSSSTAPDTDDGAIPDDCAQLLAVADLGALLGLPLDSVAVRTTIDVPAPSVGRTERVACAYTGTAGGPARGRTLLDLHAAAYVDANAAADQWRRNIDVEDGVRRELPLGGASAMLVERPGAAVLMVVYSASTLTVVLPDRMLSGDRTGADALVDLALRVLPGVVPPSAIPPDAGSGQAADAVS